VLAFKYSEMGNGCATAVLTGATPLLRRSIGIFTLGELAPDGWKLFGR